jgi:hypothetical protein
VTQDPGRHVPFRRPESYERGRYRHVIRAIDAGRVSRLLHVMLLGPERVRVNGKADVIANVVGGADDYPEAAEEQRLAIERQHRDYTLGLFWFLQHDPVVPAAVREEARSWGLAADEFADNDHFPYELYVREARRIAGRALATEHDFLLEPGHDRSPRHDDAVAVADYVIDSHPAHLTDTPPYEEGHLNVRATVPGQVRFGSLVPVDGSDVQGLLVPVALSSTHVGFAVIRMEPVWMALGAVAATAACLALDSGTLPHALPVTRLQAELARRDHRLAYFHDVPLELRSPGLQFLAAQGGFDSFYARPHDAVTRSEAARWIARWLDMAWSDGRERPEGLPARATAAPPFPDVGHGHADYAVVERLRAFGIVDSWLDSGGFCAAAPLRRSDAVRWLRAAAALGRGDAAVMEKREPTFWGGSDGTGGRPYLPVQRVELCNQVFAMWDDSVLRS